MPKEKKYFGTDGVRGVANTPSMDGELAMKIGRAVVEWLNRSYPQHRHPKVVVGKDTRLSGYMIESALCSGISSMGGTALLSGPIPTPAISFLTTSMRADAGIMISASHNPFQDNGIKIFRRDGFKLSDEEELEIEDFIDRNGQIPRPSPKEMGQMFRISDALGRYIVELKHSFPKELTLDGVKIAIDCANGAAYKSAPMVLHELGATLFPTCINPNGTNINDGCGALHPEVVARLVLEHGADLGISLDGDADRVIIIDEKGNVVDGDAIMVICALRMLADKKLARKTLVATVMSNMGVEIAIEAAGGKVVRTPVGDRYVAETMKKHGYNFGGEQSGHLIFLEHASTGDGVLAALKLLEVMIREGKPLSELSTSLFTPMPQTLVNVMVNEKKPLQEIPRVTNLIRKIEKSLGKNGRVVVRYSGTEKKIRIMVEGEEREKIEMYARSIAQEIEKTIGVSTL